MSPSTVNPLLAPFRATAEEVVRARPGVEPGIIREVFQEAATMLHDGLALEGLEEHDTAVVVAGLCVALVDPDPGAALRARSEDVLVRSDGLRDAEGASAAYLVAASILQV